MEKVLKFNTQIEYDNNNLILYPHVVFTNDNKKIWMFKNEILSPTTLDGNEIDDEMFKVDYENNMTWEEFFECNSIIKLLYSYSYITDDGYVHISFDVSTTGDDKNYLMLGNEIVKSSDVIKKGGKYWAYEPTDPIEFYINKYYEASDKHSLTSHITNKNITWKTWVERANNGGGERHRSNYVVYSGCIARQDNYSNFITIQKDGVNVLPSDKIIEGAEYSEFIE